MTELKVKLEYDVPKLEDIGRFHQEVATVEPCDQTQNKRVVISSGFGCGHTDFYVSVNGKRIIVMKSQPFLTALVDAALAEANGKRSRKKE